ncbi:hypothetical protein CI109_101250 [Kwoniella shandongensis]|uniref:Conserved oligomeric Golgi complex subunit 8 n=1 Tax=Kwoniella shandongensis TaxID=1734106 RepID=A0A5M6BTI4_9TREE|nr:uncharacterized protein CI109_005432 [Kwoniella shandongensis]KAA5526154.1 hypothetical protein CI109_005432 [Kwoniella shandongensis]
MGDMFAPQYDAGQDDTLPSLIDLLQTSNATHSDLSTPAASSYLDQLLSLPLHDLVRQPSSISVEASTVESDLINLCFREYPTFISVHKCSSAVKSAFDDFSGSLGKLIGSIPSLEDECRSFTSTTSSIQRVRGKAALVQEHQDKLQDLLELPQLMETCVRNGYYQEAMELLAHSRSLAQRYANIALVQDVAKEVEGILQLMLAQLLALLREPVKLPALVKTVAFLRRLNAIDETELGLVFIASRYYNFRTQLAQIERDKTEPVRYLRKYIDLFREHVYDIIAQFTAIFLDSPEALPHITSFAHQAIAELVDLVGSHIPRISSDSASMSSILIQLGYCAMSFSRVGLDFSALISAPFASTSVSAFSQTLATSSHDFATILRESAKLVLPPGQTLVTAEHLPTISSAPTSPPPITAIDGVTHYPPFAKLTNAHLTAFNHLRLLAPLDNRSQIVSIHTSALLTSTSSLLLYISQAVSLSDTPTIPTHRARPSHSRTPSSPRADLLRRNSETQMTPEARAAKRREARRVCVASANVWCRIVVPFLVERLHAGVFGDEVAPLHNDLQDKLEELEKWVDEHGESSTASRPTNEQPLNAVTEETNGDPVTPPRRKPPQLPEVGPVTPPSRKPDVEQQEPFTPPPRLATPEPLDSSNILPITSRMETVETSFDTAESSKRINSLFHVPSKSSSDPVHTASSGNTTVPVPVNLRESSVEVVQHIEAQLEARDMGLSGEAAAMGLSTDSHDSSVVNVDIAKSNDFEAIPSVEPEQETSDLNGEVRDTNRSGDAALGSTTDSPDTPTAPDVEVAKPIDPEMASTMESDKNTSNVTEARSTRQLQSALAPALDAIAAPEVALSDKHEAGPSAELHSSETGATETTETADVENNTNAEVAETATDVLTSTSEENPAITPVESTSTSPAATPVEPAETDANPSQPGSTTPSRPPSPEAKAASDQTNTQHNVGSQKKKKKKKKKS